MAVIMILKAVVSVAGISAVLATLLVIAEKYLADYGECKIDINSGDKVLRVTGGASLLSSLASIGILGLMIALTMFISSLGSMTFIPSFFAFLEKKKEADQALSGISEEIPSNTPTFSQED